MKQKLKNFAGVIMIMCIISLMPISVHAYSGSAAVDYARSHCVSNHTEYKSNCPNGWLCAEFVANCVRAGGEDIVPSNLKGVRALNNKLSTIGTRYNLEISTAGTSNGDRYIKNTGANAGKIAVGDVIITYCKAHDLYLHAILVSSIDSNGYVYAYAHNGNNFNRIVTASRSCMKINYNKENYSNINAYVIHFNSTSPSVRVPYYAAASGTDGTLAINRYPKASYNGGVQIGSLPENAVCIVYPSNASGNWQWVEYNGVQGYAYGKYLKEVYRSQSGVIESAHPHQVYNVYTNGYKEYTGTAASYTSGTVAPTCTTQGYDYRRCSYCFAEERTNYKNATGHLHTVIKNASKATYTKTGYTGDKYCKDCGRLLSRGSKIAKKSIIGATVKDTKTNGVYKVLKDGRSVEYTKPVSNKTAVNIPATVKILGKTYKVTQISASAFKYNKTIKTVSIGINIKKIGTYAFYGCKNLRSITINSTGLTNSTVGSKAFSGIYSRAMVKIPVKKWTAYKKLLKSKGMGSKVIYLKKYF